MREDVTGWGESLSFGGSLPRGTHARRVEDTSFAVYRQTAGVRWKYLINMDRKCIDFIFKIVSLQYRSDIMTSQLSIFKFVDTRQIFSDNQHTHWVGVSELGDFADF